MALTDAEADALIESVMSGELPPRSPNEPPDKPDLTEAELDTLMDGVASEGRWNRRVQERRQLARQDARETATRRETEAADRQNARQAEVADLESMNLLDPLQRILFNLRMGSVAADHARGRRRKHSETPRETPREGSIWVFRVNGTQVGAYRSVSADHRVKILHANDDQVTVMPTTGVAKGIFSVDRRLFTKHFRMLPGSTPEPTRRSIWDRLKGGTSPTD
jgi:hypothetical protein